MRSESECTVWMQYLIRRNDISEQATRYPNLSLRKKWAALLLKYKDLQSTSKSEVFIFQRYFVSKWNLNSYLKSLGSYTVFFYIYNQHQFLGAISTILNCGACRTVVTNVTRISSLGFSVLVHRACRVSITPKMAFRAPTYLQLFCSFGYLRSWDTLRMEVKIRNF